MRILLTGRDGQLGRELHGRLGALGTVLATTRADLDLADAEAVRAAVRDNAPQLIVNAAAYTAVDRAEEERALAHAVNAQAPGILADEAARIDALLVHFSTDFVFDGTKDTPYVEEDEPNPLGVYGESKFAGERAIATSRCRHLILRTSWVYAAHGRNFLRTMLRLAADRDELRVVADQVGTPTAADDLADAVMEVVRGALAGGRPLGLYHASGAGMTSWHGFASAIIDETAASRAHTVRVTPIGTAEYPLPARRPAYSVLSCDKLRRDYGVMLPDWRDALRRTCARIAAG